MLWSLAHCQKDHPTVTVQDKLIFGSWANSVWVPKHGGKVAVSKEFVEQHNLFLGAAPLQDNASEFHYLVAGYHQLHCLVSHLCDTNNLGPANSTSGRSQRCHLLP